SPLDYAKDSSDYAIVPGVCVASEGNGSIVVCFKEGIKRVSTLAADPAFASEIILTKIILAEEFEIEPVIVPSAGPVEHMLERADAALLAGDAAFRQSNPSAGFIDIVEEWVEMTGLPYVHALWCVHEHRMSPQVIEQVQAACAKGVAGISDIAFQFPKDERRGVQEFLESFTYELLPNVQDGLSEFMKYLYYHGVTPDVSDLNFYRKKSEADSLPRSVSPN
ncbi:MAG TPA: MqnA/MqnD/SBP family protein, partial [Bacteroidota bacterium]|nr:MqnA/MqnD/SBP family protein [Bacteroidota bacterium]